MTETTETRTAQKGALTWLAECFAALGAAIAQMRTDATGKFVIAFKGASAWTHAAAALACTVAGALLVAWAYGALPSRAKAMELIPSVPSIETAASVDAKIAALREQIMFELLARDLRIKDDATNAELRAAVTALSERVAKLRATVDAIPAPRKRGR